MKLFHIMVLCLLPAVMVGCNSEPSFIAAVSGKITKGGQPVNQVEVRFVPLDEKLGKYIASGISDEEGNFTIAIPGREDSVCCVGPCKVTVREAPVPDEVRSRLERNEGSEGGNALTRHQASLKNRPIPRNYERLHSTPLSFDVVEGQADGYDIEL